MVIRRDVIAGLAWTSASTFGRRILALAANIALARLLAPADFGLVAMAAVVIGFVDVFKDLGTGTTCRYERYEQLTGHARLVCEATAG